MVNMSVENRRGFFLLFFFAFFFAFFLLFFLLFFGGNVFCRNCEYFAGLSLYLLVHILTVYDYKC